MDKNEMSDTPLLKKYIDSVDGMAHQSAIEIIINLEKKLETAKTEYERGFDDGFILRKEKDGNGQSEYICSCGIRVTPHKCPKG